MKKKKPNLKRSKLFKGYGRIHINDDIWYWKCGREYCIIISSFNEKYIVPIWEIVKFSSYDIEIIRDNEIWLTTEKSNYHIMGHGGIRPCVIKEYIEKIIVPKK